MTEKSMRENAKRIADKYIGEDGRAPKRYCDEALEAAGIKPVDGEEEKITALAELSELAYQRRRAEAAAELGIRVIVLDKIVRQHRTKSNDQEAALPHWEVEPWAEEVCRCATLLDDIVKTFAATSCCRRALAMRWLYGRFMPGRWMPATSRRSLCSSRRPSVAARRASLIVLLYLTPRSELASNISSSALFRYIEEVRPTLLIDEADSFVKDNEEMRGILNSGHTKAAAYVIRNVEVNGEHKPRRFSTWAPKAIATIRALADTLEDRSIVVQLQRKPRAASVIRLRRRDNDEFAHLRSRAARWAADNFSKLTEPDPEHPRCSERPRCGQLAAALGHR